MKTLFIIFILFLSGCGSKSNYPILDAVISGMSVSKVENYFDLDPQQEREFEKNLEKDLQRLKEERLREIAKSLRTIDQKIPTEKADSRILSDTFVMLDKEYTLSSGYFKNSAVKMTNSLRDEQFTFFEKKVKKEIAESRAEPVSIKNDELLARYRKQFEFWVGKLSASQEQSLMQFVYTEPFPWKERIDNREKILDAFMVRRRDSAKLRAMTEQFMVDYDSLRTPEYAAAIERYETRYKDFLNKFWTTLTPEQKSQMQVSLNQQATELEHLARNSSADK